MEWMKMDLRIPFILMCMVDCYSMNVLWGPGLSPDKIVMPARYFFLQIPHSKENVIVTKDDLDVKITGEAKNGPCRIWVDTLDRKDNSFIIRYSLYESCKNLKISIKHKNVHMGMSPYNFAGPIVHDNCNCPAGDFSSWAEAYQCPNEIEQINSDMKPFHDVNMSRVIEDVKLHYNRPGSISLCHYAVKNNELYRQCYGQHVGFHVFSDAVFLSILRKVTLPDMSFFMNLGDWPLVKNHGKLVPIFSWCGSTDTHDIVLPTYDITEATLENMGRVMLDMLSIQGNIGRKWTEKYPRAFWRGRDSSRERLDLIDIARQHTDLYNVSLTNFFFYKNEEHIYGPIVPRVSFFKFFDFKYLINLDGTVAAYRLPYLLAGDSLVLKQESPYYEHFYRQLKPGEHYLPFKRDLSDLTEKILWAVDNDEKARTISKNAQEFTRAQLMPKDIICYYAMALKEWSKRLGEPIQNYEGMEKVEQKVQEADKCHCEGVVKKMMLKTEL